MIRVLQYLSLKVRRQYRRGDTSAIARMLRSDLVRWEQGLVARGTAVGMFWAFIPMPFQMVPAALFCWLIRANLPVAIVCVWLTNPITLPPILLLEYAIGRWIADAAAAAGTLSFLYSGGPIASSLQALLTGALVLSCAGMFAGFLLAHTAFYFSRKQRLKERFANMQQLAAKALHHQAHSAKAKADKDSVKQD